MPNIWITTASSNVEAMVNSFTAACDSGFVPDQMHVLSLPEVEAEVDEAQRYASRVADAYAGTELTVHETSLDDETEFGRIQEHVQNAIEAAKDRGDEVAVDITPGRKFMSAIAFAAGMRYDADHVYYLYVGSTEYFGRLYPEIPRTALHLYDFTEGY